MSQVGIITGIVTAGSGVTIMARIRGVNGSLITQASLSTITYAIRDLTDGATDSTGSLTISSVVFDSLQQASDRWTISSADTPHQKDKSYGYNFLAEFAASLFTDFDVGAASPYDVTPHVFEIDIKFTPASGQPFVLAAKFTPIPTYV